LAKNPINVQRVGGSGMRHKTVIFLQHNPCMMKFKELSRFTFQLKVTGAGLPGMAFFRVLATFLASVYFSYVLFFVVSIGAADADQPTTLGSPVPAAIETSNVPPPPDLLQIADWHLFGRSANGQQASTSVSETQLQLKLLGVFLFSQAPENTSVIIQADDGQQKKYRPGEELPGGAILKTVEHSRVVIEHNNRQEFLALERNKAALPATTE